MKKISIFLSIALMAILVFSCGKKKETPAPDQGDQGGQEKVTIITIEDFTKAIDENPKAGASLGNIIATASDSKKLSYELKNLTVADALKIDATTGELTVNNAALFDFEINPSITAEFTAIAGGQSKKAKITITINDVVGEPFVTKWETTSDEEIISIIKSVPETYNFDVDWGDGTDKESFDGTKPQYDHKYEKAGEYIVSITGTFPAFNFLDQKALKTVLAWGDNKWKYMSKMFKNTSIVRFEALGVPDLSECTSLSAMFSQAASFNGNLSQWKTSTITSMSYMFEGATSFEGDVSNWDVSKVKQMASMFAGATLFRSDISGWDTSSAENYAMISMFESTKNFNHDLTKWVVNGVPKGGWDNFAKNSELECKNVPSRFTGTGCK